MNSDYRVRACGCSCIPHLGFAEHRSISGTRSAYSCCRLGYIAVSIVTMTKTTGRIHWRIKHTINDLSQFGVDNLDKLVHGCWGSERLLASSSGWNGEVPIQSSLAFTALPHSSILLFISCKLSIPSVVKVNIATTGGASCSSGRGGV